MRVFLSPPGLDDDAMLVESSLSAPISLDRVESTLFAPIISFYFYIICNIID